VAASFSRAAVYVIDFIMYRIMFQPPARSSVGASVAFLQLTYSLAAALRDQSAPAGAGGFVR